VSGRLHVDAGARRAVVEDGASLLAVGVASVEGRFEAGDAVELVGPDGSAFAKGIVGAPSSDLARRSRGVEAVHRDRLVLY
jgi:glutamate 5-kinase